jgi:hypothetical protein
MYVLSLESADVRKYEGGVVGEKEVTVANVEDLATKIPGSKLLLELYNKRTGESVAKFSSRAQGLNRLWKVISNGQAEMQAAVVEVKEYEDKATLKKRLAKERKAAKTAVVGTIAPAEKKVAGPRTGKYRGKRLYKKVDSNPRRQNSWGWRSFEAFKDGDTYEQAIANGARRVDLDWDVKRGHIEVKGEVA